jgi:lysyl-tRNA synthetase class 2
MTEPRENPNPAADAAEDMPAIVAQRYAKAERLRAEGVDPYPTTTERTHAIAEVLAAQEALQADGTEVTVCGRVGPIRLMGKAAFFHLSDATGRIQVYLKKNNVGDEPWQAFKDGIEFCDFAQVTGPLMVTKTGEITVEGKAWRLLTKTVRPLPKEHFGLRDREARYRRRHADLAANPDVREVFLTRAKIVSAIRRWLERTDHEFGGYVEVESPVLHALAGGALARPFVTHHNALDMELYLRIALELFHKRCVVGGIERVYEIGRIFRNEGISTRHNPEFTMLELYTAYVDVSYTERLTEAMVRHAAQEVIGTLQLPWGDQSIDLERAIPRVPLCTLVSRLCGNEVDPSMSSADLRKALGKHGEDRAGADAPAPLPEEPGKMLFEVFERHVEHTLVEPTFVTLFPKSVSPLAKAHPANPALAERSELFLGGLEVAPMYTEINDPADQRARFEAQMRERAAGDEEAMPMDTDFLDALEHGMPPTSGLGVGIDRLVMLLTNQQSIRDVILFPLMRPTE